MRQSYDDYMSDEWNRQEAEAEREREIRQENAEREAQQIDYQIEMLQDKIEDIRGQINDLEYERHRILSDI